MAFLTFKFRLSLYALMLFLHLGLVGVLYHFAWGDGSIGIQISHGQVSLRQYLEWINTQALLAMAVPPLVGFAIAAYWGSLQVLKRYFAAKTSK